MNKLILIWLALFTFAPKPTYAQKNKSMEGKNNPLICDPQIGVCGTVDKSVTPIASADMASKKIRIIYFTDPICSSCWGIEPQLRKLKLAYGESIDIEYRMGGLLPDWSYNSGGISKPSDVAHHWDEVSQHYDMPIDGDVWLDDPLDSSYPPSIAFKAAQIQDQSKAIAFLREIREMVFLKKINIAKWANLALAASNVGLDVARFEKDFNGIAQKLFQEDLAMAKEYGVRGFPTLFFVKADGQQTKVYGARPYQVMVDQLRSLLPNLAHFDYDHTWQKLFEKYPTLTANEFAQLAEMDRAKVEPFLDEITNQGHLVKYSSKNGAIWKVK